MVEHLARSDVAPVVVVIAGAGEFARLPTHADHRPHLAPRYHGQPRDVVLLLGAEEHVTSGRPPRRKLRPKREIGYRVVDFDVDQISVVGTAESVGADLDVAVVDGSRKRLGLGNQRVVGTFALGRRDRHQDEGRQRRFEGHKGRFGVHFHRHRPPVVEVGIEVPPFKGAPGPRRGTGPPAVFPWLNLVGHQPKSLVVP
ncbi:hypothetical protein [Mycobacterium gordonae]|uniref:hypothetical protein n=1 Tax=Mycobacterium gordonae TaxID=1778 RepID=UPI0012EA1302|nr:hypothetical protein [Mycobacterium gordonae]